MELMKIFFHMNVIDAVCIGILVLVLLVGLFCVFCQGITESIVKRRKRKARKLLSDELKKLNDELKKLNDDLQYYKEKWLGRQDIVLSETIVSMILKFLPSPNECVNNLSIIEKNSKMNCGTFELQIVSFFPGDSIRIKIVPLNITISIVHRKDSIRSNMYGLNYDITTYCWDFAASGIRVIGDEEFKIMDDFVVSGNKAAQETGLSDYNKK